MKNRDRARLRRKQNKLLEGLPDNSNDHLHLSAAYPGSPTVGGLREFIYPEWEWLIDQILTGNQRAI